MTDTFTETDQDPLAQSDEERNQLLLGYGLVFNQLLQSEKFRMFVETFYTIQKVLNEEERTIEIRVIENPPEVAGQRLQTEVTNATNAAAAPRPRREKPLVELADNAKADKVIAQAKAKAKKGQLL